MLVILVGCAFTTGQAHGDTAAVRQSSPKDNAVYIAAIEIHGNKTTRPEVLKHYIAFDTGQVLDTAKLRATRANLLATQLYDKVDIFPHMREDGAHVFIILTESVRLQLWYGAGYVTRKYGEDKLWFQLNASAAIENFRGRMEELYVGASIWDLWALNLGWHKPFLSTPYFIALSAGIATYPDESLPLDYIDVYGRMAVGRKFGNNLRLALSAIPIYRHRTVVQSALDSGNVAPFYSDDLYEAFAMLALTADYRSARFDPQSGWFLHSHLRTNRLYSGINIPFFQLTNDFQYYQPTFLNALAALRLKLVLRDTDAGAYHRLTYGGAGEIRGYGDKILGWQFPANSSFLASVKYHQPLWKSPPLPTPLVNLVFTGVHNLTYRIDAALIADYAALFREPLGAVTLDSQRQDGIGLGFGTRIVIPEIRQSACVDLVWGRNEKSGGEIVWSPMLHLYLDLFF
jgi:outer membrane protein assembly factor BamA